MIVLVWDNRSSTADIKRDGGPIVVSDSLETAVILSLFCFRTRELVGVPLPGQERRGYWADAFRQNDRFGSGLWQLLVSQGDGSTRRGGGKINEEVMELAKNEILSALDWMIEDGVASKVECDVQRFDLDRLLFETRITKADGERYTEQWDATIAA